MRAVNILAKRKINDILRLNDIVGGSKFCEYYPCHGVKNQDCTWCCCPVYVCFDRRTGGKYVHEKGRPYGWVWDCSNCTVVHKPEVAKEMFKEIKKINKPYEEWDINDRLRIFRIVKVHINGN